MNTKYQNPIAKALSKKPSRRLAINAHCYMCMGGSNTDLRTRKNVVSLIRWCNNKNCPLSHFRPYTPSSQQVKQHNEEYLK